MAIMALVDLIARVAWIVAGVEKACEPFLLVVPQDRHPDRRGDDQREVASNAATPPDRREVPPGHPGEEEDRECDDPEHDARAEVGLQEDECGRRQAERQQADGLAQVGAAAGALDHERGERDDQQHLGELRGLEAEVGELDPAPRAAGGGAEDEHEADRRDHRPVDADPELAEARVVDPRDGEHQRDPDQRVDDLAQHEVERVARDVVAGRRGQGEEAEGDQPEGGGQHHSRRGRAG